MANDKRELVKYLASMAINLLHHNAMARTPIVDCFGGKLSPSLVQQTLDQLEGLGVNLCDLEAFDELDPCDEEECKDWLVCVLNGYSNQ